MSCAFLTPPCPQVAIVSWSGESCGTADNPDVDTKVAAFYDWIEEAIGEVEAGRD